MNAAPRAVREQRPARRMALPRRPGGGGLPRLIRDTYGELKKVVWPTRDQVVNLSTVVIIASIAIGIMLGAVDWMFSQLVNAFLTTGQTVPPIG